MHKIQIDGKTLGYEKDVRKIADYMIKDDRVASVNFDGSVRELILDSGRKMTIEKIDKDFGTQGGDICSVCKMGELKEYGGCATCSNCGAQIKCGL